MSGFPRLERLLRLSVHLQQEAAFACCLRQFGRALRHQLTVDLTSISGVGLPQWRTSEMAKKGVLDEMQDTVAKAAKASATGVKEVTVDALGAAASAAAGVVLGRVSEALGGGSRKANEAATSSPAVSPNTTRPKRGTTKTGSSTKAPSATRTRSGTKARTATKQSAVKKRSPGKASRKTSATAKGAARKRGAKNPIRGRRAR